MRDKREYRDDTRAREPKGVRAPGASETLLPLADPRTLEHIASYNHLRAQASLDGRVWALRHGFSAANRENLIASDPKRDVDAFGLTPEGILSVRDSVSAAKAAGQLSSDTIVVSSPFLRAVESAQIAVAILGARPAKIDARLRERFFGSLNRTSAECYQRVWDLDITDPIHGHFEGESVAQVCARLTECVVDLTHLYAPRTVLLVSHGDPLNILSSCMSRVSPQFHRGTLLDRGIMPDSGTSCDMEGPTPGRSLAPQPLLLQPFRTGELRELVLLPTQG